MRVIKPTFEILTPIDRDAMYKQIERCARVCYKSEDKITEDSAPKMVKNLIKREHLAMLEHVIISVKFICDRGVSHEIVRHRMASYAQESTRYCNYSAGAHGNEITVIEPFFFKKGSAEYKAWYDTCRMCERTYMELLKMGASPQEARTVLPNSLKTEIVVTFNLRQWIHFFNLRAVGTTGAPHPQMKEISVQVLGAFVEAMPEVFADQYVAATIK